MTIIIPMFNAGKFITQALWSCLRQTYQDVEVLVVDDCSTDTSVAVVEGFSDVRIRLIRHSSNQGVGPARNSGLLSSTGEWISVLDADDCYLPQRIEFLLDLAKSRGKSHVYTDDWRAWHLPTTPPMPANIPIPDTVRQWHFGDWLANSREARPFFHRQLLAGMPEWYSNDSIGEDVVFVSRLVTHNDCRIFQLSAQTYVYRNTPGSLTTPSLRTAEAKVAACSRILEEVPTKYRSEAWKRLEMANAEVLVKRIRMAMRNGHVLRAARLVLQNPKRSCSLALRVCPYFRMRWAASRLRRQQVREATGRAEC